MNRILVFGAAVLILGSAPALAQITVPGPMSSPDGQNRNARVRKPAEASPAGVPGARAEPDLVAPAERVPTDMPPNEALFDAINRGDLSAAKDAIGRGADIHGRNVLGLTPLELSVDLGRNDISFLLLSLRGGAGYGSSGQPRSTAAATEPKTPAQTRAEQRAEQQARRAQAAAERAAMRASTQAPASPRNARLFAGDGGAPVPQAGFLGFDSAR